MSLFDKYRFHIQVFEEFIRRIFNVLRQASFRTLRFSRSKNFKTQYLSKRLLFFLVCFETFGWAPGTRPIGPHIMKMKPFSEFSKWNQKGTSPKMKQNSFTELLGHSFQTPQTPNPEFVPDFRRFSVWTPSPSEPYESQHRSTQSAHQGRFPESREPLSWHTQIRKAMGKTHHS